jgi:hypothetical protein
MYRCFPNLNISYNSHTVCMGEARNRGSSIVSRSYRPTLYVGEGIPARCVTPALGGSPPPRFRPRGISMGPDYPNALRYVVPTLLCPAKTTCSVRRRPGICLAKWTFNLVFIDLHNLGENPGRQRTRHAALTRGTGARGNKYCERRAFG